MSKYQLVSIKDKSRFRRPSIVGILQEFIDEMGRIRVQVFLIGKPIFNWVLGIVMDFDKISFNIMQFLEPWFLLLVHFIVSIIIATKAFVAIQFFGW